MAELFIPKIRIPNIGEANRNALAEALAQQKFIGGVRATRQAAKEKELTAAAVSAQGPEAQGNALRKLGSQNPEAAIDAHTFLSGLSQDKRDETERKAKFLGKAALGVLSATGSEKPALYESSLALAVENGFDVSSMPQQYSPELEPQLQSMLGQSLTMSEQIGRVNLKVGNSEKIVKLQAAQVEARRRGDDKSYREIQEQINKINAPALGRTGFDPQVNPPTKANITKAQQVIDDGDFTLAIIDQIEEVIVSKNLGAVGSTREFFMGIGQQLEAAADSIIDHAIKNNSDLNLGLLFSLDPALAGQKFLENILAYRLALANNPDGRISDPDFKAAQEALGFDKTLTGAGDVGARLSQFRRLVGRQQDIARRRLGIKKPVKEPETNEDTGIPAGDTPEGTNATNEATGEKLIVKDGKWIPK